MGETSGSHVRMRHGGFGDGGEGTAEEPAKGSWDGTCATAGIPTP